MKTVANTSSENTGTTYSKKIGLDTVKVVGVNFDKDQLCSFLNIEDPAQVEKFKEPEYIKENTEGDTVSTIVFHLEGVNSDNKSSFRINLTDKDYVSKNTGKTQYVNCVGQSSWVEKESDLQPWFTSFMDKDKNVTGTKVYRVAKAGEVNLTDFISRWSNIDVFNPENDVLPKMKDLFIGKYKELTSLVKDLSDNTLVTLNTIHTNDEGKQYANVWKEVLPGNKAQVLTSGRSDYMIDRFLKNLKDFDYGCKDEYLLQPLHDYVASEVTESTAPDPTSSDY